MIGVEGQYVMTISIQDQLDFIKEADLEHFTRIETAGGGLPEFQMAFVIRDPKILGYLNNRNDIVIMYGRTKDKMTKTHWKIGYPAMSPSGDEAYIVQLKGVMRAGGYVTTPITGIYSGTSSQVIEGRAQANGFVFDGNNNANDKMNWIQPGITDWQFIQDTYVRYYGNGDSPCAIAVTSNNQFRMYDIRKHVNSKRSNPDWVLRTAVETLGPKDMIPADGITVKVGNELLNQWAGFGRYLVEESIVQGVSREVASGVLGDETLFGSAGLKDQVPPVGASDQRLSAVEILIDDNVHQYWNKAYLDNLTRLARASSVQVVFSVDGEFYDAHALDVVNYIAKEIQTEGDNGMAKFSNVYSGLYIIETASFKYSNRRVSQSFVLTRDANADQKSTDNVAKK